MARTSFGSFGWWAGARLSVSSRRGCRAILQTWQTASAKGSTGYARGVPRRERPLALQIAGNETILIGSEVDELIGASERLRASIGEHALRRPGKGDEALLATIQGLSALEESLATAAPGPLDPPLAIGADEAKLLRRILAELVGYQRGDLSDGLKSLRRELA